MNIPEGWPTEEMVNAGIVAYMNSHGRNAKEAMRLVIQDALAAASTPPAQVSGLHPATADLVTRFANALAQKLSLAEKKYGYSDGWLSPDWMDECRTKLQEHIAKGDPRDVAAYCAFLWHHGESTVPAQEDEPVAMVYHHKSGAGIGGTRWKHLPHGTNLYTHPADDKLRKAAEDARRLLKVFLFCEQEAISWEEIEEGKVVLTQLRVALRDNYGNATETQ